MRAAQVATMSALVLGLSSGVMAQDVCSNIRLSVSEQIECRGRVTNALGDADRQRVQQEFEDRVRRAQDQLIAPPALRSNPPGTTTLPNTVRPSVPSVPAVPQTPERPGTLAPGLSLPTPATGEIAKPGGAPPSGSALVPDTTAPDPTRSPLPPISPLPVNPAGALPPLE